VSNTELAGVGLQDVREHLVESDLDIRLRNTNMDIVVVEWSQVQLHEHMVPLVDVGKVGRWATSDGYMNLGKRSEM